MERHLGHFSTRLLVLASLLATAGCGQLFEKSCQPPSGPVRNLEDATWRLVYTNNPSARYRAYGNFIYDFEIWQWDRQFGFQAKRVLRNKQFNQPIQTGTYDTDGVDLMVIDLKSVSTSQDDNGNSQQQETSLGRVNFRYAIGSKLELQDLRSGYYYKFYQFTGVVSPSQSCVFK